MSPLAIEVVGLTKTFGRDTIALNGVDFSVQAGTVCGLLGHNGAGKTTTINILSTLIRPSSGRASVAGYDSRASLPRCGPASEWLDSSPEWIPC